MRTLLAASVITVYFFGWLCLGETCGVVPVVVAAVAMCGIGVMTRPPILTGAEDFDEKTLVRFIIILSHNCMNMNKNLRQICMSINFIL